MLLFVITVCVLYILKCVIDIKNLKSELIDIENNKKENVQ